MKTFDVKSFWCCSSWEWSDIGMLDILTLNSLNGHAKTWRSSDAQQRQDNGPACAHSIGKVFTCTFPLKLPPARPETCTGMLQFLII